jgi:hypothetical protein
MDMDFQFFSVWILISKIFAFGDYEMDDVGR